MLKKVLKYCVEEKAKLCLILLLKLLITVFTVIHPLIFADMIDSVIHGNYQTVFGAFALHAFLQVVLIIINHILRRLDVIVSKNINHHVKSKILSYIFHIPPYDNDISQGKIHSLIVSDSKAVYSFVSSVISTAFTILTVIGVGIVTLITDWRLTLILFIPYPLIILINRIFRKQIKEKTKSLLEQNDLFLSMLKNTLGNISDVQNQNGMAKIIKAVDDESNKGREAAIKQGQTQNNFHISIGFAGFVGNSIFTLSGLILVMMQMLSLGDFVAFSSYSKSLSANLNSLFSLKTNLQPLYVSLERLLEVEEKFNQSQDREKSKMNLEENIVSLELKNVSVSYGKNIVLKDVSLSLAKGNIIGFYGLNGTGKTTLARLISSMIRATSGHVFINNRLLQEYNFFSLSQHIDYVGANKNIYYISIKDNIMLSHSYGEGEFSDICKMLNIDDYVLGLDDGYQTIINESIGFSTGQIQKIQIARAFHKQSDIIIFDESMSNLDEETRKNVYNKLKELSNDRIIIIISHAAKDYEICDIVYRIENKTLIKIK